MPASDSRMVPITPLCRRADDEQAEKRRCTSASARQKQKQHVQALEQHVQRGRKECAALRQEYHALLAENAVLKQEARTVDNLLLVSCSYQAKINQASGFYESARM